MFGIAGVPQFDLMHGFWIPMESVSFIPLVDPPEPEVFVDREYTPMQLLRERYHLQMSRNASRQTGTPALDFTEFNETWIGPEVDLETFYFRLDQEEELVML